MWALEGRARMGLSSGGVWVGEEVQAPGGVETYTVSTPPVY